MGSGFEWLLWPSLALLGGVLALGAGLGIRRTPLESPRDLLRLPGVAFGILLSLVVELATEAAEGLRAQRAALVQATTLLTRLKTSSGIDSLVARRPTKEGLLSGLVGLLLTLFGRLNNGDADRSDSPGRSGPRPERPPEPVEGDFDIESAWAWLAHRTVDRRAGASTPDDIARNAIARGYPREPVRDLLSVFRDVTYGELPPTDDRLETAREAYETLRAAERSMGHGDHP